MNTASPDLEPCRPGSARRGALFTIAIVVLLLLTVPALAADQRPGRASDDDAGEPPAGQQPEQLQVLYRNLENNFAPWQFSPEDRGAWADGLEIPTLAELGSAEEIDYLFWVGCSGSFDARYKKVSVALAKIMQEAGLRFAIHKDFSRRFTES